jgi:hypothetical protein
VVLPHKAAQLDVTAGYGAPQAHTQCARKCDFSRSKLLQVRAKYAKKRFTRFNVAASI